MKNKLWILGVILSFTVLLASCGGSKGGTTITTGVVTTFAGIAGNPGSLDATGTAATFHTPYGIASDGTSLFVADTGNSTIRKIDIASGLVSTLTGSAGVSGSTDGTGTAALFRAPCGITTDGTNLYVADTGNNTIRKVVISTREVTTLVGSAGVPGSTDGTGTDALFRAPCGITTDGTNLYVADTGNNTIRKIDIASGLVSTLTGSAGVSGSTDGTGTAATFNLPFGITSDGTNLYVADTGNSAIRKVDISTGTTGVVTTMTVTDATGAAATFHTPYGIATDGTSLFVADTGNNTLRKIDIASGVVTAFVGAAGVSGSTDGTGATAFFNHPAGITIDGTIMYVTDTGNDTIRKVVISSGVVTTLAGSAGVSGSTDGTGAAASFARPVGISSYGSNLYVADTLNSTIRKIQ